MHIPGAGVLMLRPIGPGAAEYYWRGPDPGHWSGHGARALGLDGMPSPEALTRVLAGRHPVSGEHVGHAHSHRRAGWDLIFAAPKSVSLLAAVTSTGDSRTMSMAHREAVAETLAWIEGEAVWARRQRARVAADGVVAAVFEHGNNATGEPHLHTHVLLANLVQGPDGRWSALDHGSLWLERRAISSIYDLALRHQVGLHWANLRWQLGDRGLADVAGVPRQAIEAVSVRRRQVLRDLRGTPAAPSPRRTRYAAARTRDLVSSTDWRARLAQTAFRPAHATALLVSPPGSPDAPQAGPALPEAAEAWLTERGSTWSRSDAIRALAATAERGASPASAMNQVAELCRRSPAAGPGRWTTAAARRLDESVVRAATGPGLALPPVSDALLTEALDRRPGLSSTARTAVRSLVERPGRVVLLPGTAARDRLVEQAAVLEAARASWEAAGVPVALDAGAGQVARWKALAGLRQAEPGTPPGVIVADRADRRTSAELLGLFTQAAQARAKVVLVEGGTLPARRAPLSAALDGLRRLGLEAPRWLDGMGPPDGLRLPGGMGLQDGVGPPDGLRLPDVGAPQDAGSLQEGGGSPPPAVQSGTIVATATMGDAVATILARWARMPAGRRPVIVALGPPEAEALNRLARETLVAAGEVGGGEVVIGGRAFAPGDRVLARRPGPAPSATLGTVESVTPTPPTVTVRWDGGEDHARRLDAWTAQRLVHGYAATPGLAARLRGSLLLLGDPSETPTLAHRDVTGIVVAPTSGRRRDPLDRLARLAEAAGEGLPIEGRPPIWAGGGDTPATFAAVAARRDRLESDLRAALPPDVAGDRRRLDEDRAFAATHPGRPGSPDARDLEQRAVQLERSEAALAGWLRGNQERLVEWRGLVRLVDEYADLVAHAATVDLSSAARRVAGPIPTDSALRPVWQQAVRATAIHAAGWPEAAGVSPAELITRRRRDQAIRALEETRGRRLDSQGADHAPPRRTIGRDSSGLER